jgi:hypothetical protein
MIKIAEIERVDLAKYSPVFWRKSPDASEKQTPFFHSMLGRENTIALVCEEDGVIVGFVFAGIGNAPPVYDPGGLVCVIDDYGLASEDLWPTVGKALLDEALTQAKERGAVLCVVICPHLDIPKRTMLQQHGLGISSEWYVGPIG